MLPSGPSNPLSNGHSVPPSLLRMNPGMVGGSQTTSHPPQSPFSSLASPGAQLCGNNLLGNVANMSSLLNRQPLANGGPLPGVGLDNDTDLVGAGGIDPLLLPSSSSGLLGQQQPHNPNLFGLENQPMQQVDALPGMQAHSMQYNQQRQRINGGNVGPVNIEPQGNLSTVKMEPHRGNFGDIKLEPHGGNFSDIKLEPHGGSIGCSVKLEQAMGHSDQPGSTHLLCSPGSSVKLEPQQIQTLRSLCPMKPEPQHSDPSMFLVQKQQQQQQQQQQLLQLTRQNSQAAAAAQQLMQHQRILQQQLLKSLPHQRSQLQQQQPAQQIIQQNLPSKIPGKPYEPGTCAKRLTHYMYYQQNKPQDNNIEYWRNFVNEYFAPNAKKKWCVSLYGNARQTTGVFPQDGWHCEICNRKPGRGFETTVEVLPRLFQIKYASGTLEELLYVDMPREFQNPAGQIVLEYAKAVQESVFEQLRVVREGYLRIVFTPDLKIYSWEFCAKRHEELIPRRLIMPQVGQLGLVIQKYQAAAQNSSNLSASDLQSNCNTLVACARQLAKALEVPLVNDLGYTKRYVRCLQIAEVVNCMKDLIDYSKQTGTGPMDSLNNFIQRTSQGVNAVHAQRDLQQQKQTQNPMPDGQNNQMAGVQVSVMGNADGGAVHPLSVGSGTPMVTTPSSAGVTQSSMISGQDHHMSTVSNLYSNGNNAQMSRVCSSNSLPHLQLSGPNNVTPAAPNPVQLNSPSAPTYLSAMQPPASRPQESDANESQSSVQRILQEMAMSSQENARGSLGNDNKAVNGMAHGLSSSGSAGVNNVGYGPMSGIAPTMPNGLRTVSPRVGINQNPQDQFMASQQQQMLQHQHQQDIGNQILGGLRAGGNNFSNLQYDWKSSSTQ